MDNSLQVLIATVIVTRSLALVAWAVKNLATLFYRQTTLSCSSRGTQTADSYSCDLSGIGARSEIIKGDSEGTICDFAIVKQVKRDVFLCTEPAAQEGKYLALQSADDDSDNENNPLWLQALKVHYLGLDDNSD